MEETAPTYDKLEYKRDYTVRCVCVGKKKINCWEMGGGENYPSSIETWVTVLKEDPTEEVILSKNEIT